MKAWARQFYNSGMWKAVRKEALRRDHYTCKYCYGRAQEVHHVIELTPENIHDPKISLNLDNLESLCHNCHTRETKGSGDTAEGYLFDELGQIVRVSPPSNVKSF